ASSVSRSSPQRTVNTYTLRLSTTNGTVLVASPSAIGSDPDASGSSVPAWPARFAANNRLITATACVEVMPTGLSSTTQPWTSRFLIFLVSCGEAAGDDALISVTGIIRPCRHRGRAGPQAFAKASRSVPLRRTVRQHGTEFQAQTLN